VTCSPAMVWRSRYRVDDERRCWWKVSAEHEGTVTFEMHAKWLFFVKLPGYGMAPAKREIPAPKRARSE
jgi:hypothetical protein